MTNNLLTLFCLVDGVATSSAFSVEIDSTNTVDELKKLIKTEKVNDFQDVDADKLTLWRVSFLITRDNSEIPILFNNIAKEEKEKLHAADDLSDIFDEKPPKKTIHIIVQRPSQALTLFHNSNCTLIVHVPVPSRALTPLPGSLSDGSRPSSPLSGDLHADIKRITDKFFAPGSDVFKFLDPFVKGEGATYYFRIHSWFTKSVASWVRSSGCHLRGFVLYLDVKVEGGSCPSWNE
ncbi:hypothetical protein K457DRAFT_1823888 [Linnemannia elongata AG-77]|uniref:Crinkler effector protein N-terminal domain-containing protein n=1 Tax=Linnemannia elongata AG-77 TaxID=1314771 RepID=A0A197JIJ0_9FUNG|nr:hypothetical protein K457DRAFT_1823888 [Linnemannia elongata AG-77]